jgi:hypothetical protein
MRIKAVASVSYGTKAGFDVQEQAQIQRKLEGEDGDECGDYTGVYHVRGQRPLLDELRRELRNPGSDARPTNDQNNIYRIFYRSAPRAWRRTRKSSTSRSTDGSEI